MNIFTPKPKHYFMPLFCEYIYFSQIIYQLFILGNNGNVSLIYIIVYNRIETQNDKNFCIKFILKIIEIFMHFCYRKGNRNLFYEISDCNKIERNIFKNKNLLALKIS